MNPTRPQPPLIPLPERLERDSSGALWRKRHVFDCPDGAPVWESEEVKEGGEEQ